MALETVTKQPSEQFTVAVEFYGKLPPTEPSVVSATASAVINGTGTSATSTVLQSTTCTVLGTQVRVGVKGGTSGVTYKVTIVTTLSDGQLLEDDFLLVVLET